MRPHLMGKNTEMMQRQNATRVGELVLRTGIVAGMHHAELATHLGVSRRTVSRWAREGTRLPPDQVAVLARIAYPHDQALAAQIAAIAGGTLASLGLEEPARPASVGFAAPPRLLDAVVCAAAEAIDVSPRNVRAGLLAAFRCARELGLTMETMEALLSAKPPE